MSNMPARRPGQPAWDGFGCGQGGQPFCPKIGICKQAQPRVDDNLLIPNPLGRKCPASCARSGLGYAAVPFPGVIAGFTAAGRCREEHQAKHSAGRVAKAQLTLAKLTDKPSIAWNGELAGFGYRFRPSVIVSFIVSCRAGASGRNAPAKRMVVGIAAARARRRDTGTAATCPADPPVTICCRRRPNPWRA